MKEIEMRIRLIHKRARELLKEKEKRNLHRSAYISSVLCIALIAMIRMLDLHSTAYSGGSYTGSSLLSESVGGYVLVAVASFMSGVVITVIIKKYLTEKKDGEEKDENDSK